VIGLFSLGSRANPGTQAEKDFEHDYKHNQRSSAAYVYDSHGFHFQNTLSHICVLFVLP